MLLLHSKCCKQHILWDTDDTGYTASKLSSVHSISDFPTKHWTTNLTQSLQCNTTKVRCQKKQIPKKLHCPTQARAHGGATCAPAQGPQFLGASDFVRTARQSPIGWVFYPLYTSLLPSFLWVKQAPIGTCGSSSDRSAFSPEKRSICLRKIKSSDPLRRTKPIY